MMQPAVVSAKKVSERAQRFAAQASARDFREWAAEPSATGAPRKSLKETPLPPVDVISGRSALHRPRGIMNEKMVRFNSMRSPQAASLADARELFRQIREIAVHIPPPLITAEMALRGAATMKAKAGLGIDGFAPVDYQRLPEAGTQAFALLLTAIEESLARPVQTPLIAVKLTSKKVGADRGVGSVCMASRS